MCKESAQKKNKRIHKHTTLLQNSAKISEEKFKNKM